MSVYRVQSRSSSGLMADEPGLLEQFAPYIDKLVLTPQGLGLLAVFGGILLRMTRQPDLVFIGPLQGQDQSTAAHTTHRYGLDQVVFTIPIGSIEATITQAVTSAPGNVLQSITGLPVNAIIGFLTGHLQQKAATGQQSSQGGGTVDVMLSDLLILMGAGIFLGSSVGSLIPKL